MNKNQLATDLYNLINTYSDYINSGFNEFHPEIKFVPENSSTNNQDDSKTKEIHKKNEFVDIREKRKKIVELSEIIIQCSKCDLCKNSNKVTGIGNVNADIFIVAEQPSDEDEAGGRPLTGETGLFVKKWLSSIDIEINDVFITNIIKCNPKKNKITKEMIDRCREHLDNQINLIEPKIIFTLGQLPASSLKRSHYDINQYHGNIFNYNGYPVISTFSPYLVLKDGNLKKAVWNDLKILKNFLQER